MSRHDNVRPIAWTQDGLRLLDQRRLPHEETHVVVRSAAETADAIRAMVVRGAPAIGIAAAFGVVLAVRERGGAAVADWESALEPERQRLAAARPTAVNLSWALARMMRRMRAFAGGDAQAWALAEAQRIHAEDVRDNRRMGELGAALIAGADSVLTHCNAGSLATGGFGTALGVVRACAEAGRRVHVFADETRPWLQGSRLTAWELARDGIPVTVIADAAAAPAMRAKKVQAVLVGADRVARNGDVANKIGTYALAIAARRHDVPFIVVAPTSTVDEQAATGEDIPIEERDPSEVLSIAGEPLSVAAAGAWNPVFDITPASLIDALVTERGVVRKPDGAALEALLRGAGGGGRG